jgi:hypothetical protein
LKVQTSVGGYHLIIPNIYHLIIGQMLVDLDIKNSNISLPIMLGASPFFFG